MYHQREGKARWLAQTVEIARGSLVTPVRSPAAETGSENATVAESPSWLLELPQKLWLYGRIMTLDKHCVFLSVIFLFYKLKGLD